MDVMGFIFGLMGMSIGIYSFLRINVLEKTLREKGVLDKNFDSESKI